MLKYIESCYVILNTVHVSGSFLQAQVGYTLRAHDMPHWSCHNQAVIDDVDPSTSIQDLLVLAMYRIRLVENIPSESSLSA